MRRSTRSPSRRRPRWRRYADAFLAALVFAGVAFLAARLQHLAGADISGVMRVVDGDSLALGDRRLRLKGIDAPELGQRCRRDGFDYGCGADAASHLRGLIGRHEVSCKGEGIDRYGRDLVRCVADGVDLNETMVRSGHAVAFGDYELAESLARSELAGIWAGEFETPKQWRAVHGGLSEELHTGWFTVLAFLRRLFGV
ncbi:MAG: thermonuclease family protein [Hoeflea sp.]|uniref:thermonuclease family protein n=1 Tax=Hoeflea sp. TaxID=1940281 RepID=UPI002730B131|nr:thermonuclease family protein [Hoeflea sp.]MDP2122394.1 thermonuclease family protein [Hoeflea sp.]